MTTMKLLLMMRIKVSIPYFVKLSSFVFKSCFLFQTDLGPVGSFGIYMILQSIVISGCIFEAFSCWVMLISLG